MTLASDAALFSAWISSQSSWRKMRISDGASMPIRTFEPTMSSTSTTMSSAMQIRSPTLRVMTSIGVSFLPGCHSRHREARCVGLHFVQLHLCEQRLPNRVTGSAVDDLAPDPASRCSRSPGRRG